MLYVFAIWSNSSERARDCKLPQPLMLENRGLSYLSREVSVFVILVKVSRFVSENKQL
jgi:hypothetical protein